MYSFILSRQPSHHHLTDHFVHSFTSKVFFYLNDAVYPTHQSKTRATSIKLKAIAYLKTVGVAYLAKPEKPARLVNR